MSKALNQFTGGVAVSPVAVATSKPAEVCAIPGFIQACQSATPKQLKEKFDLSAYSDGTVQRAWKMAREAKVPAETILESNSGTSEALAEVHEYPGTVISAADTPLALVMTTLEQSDEALADVLKNIENLKDEEQVLALAEKTGAMIHRFHLVRGACGWTIRNIVAIRLTGGKGVIDEAGIGVTAQLKKVAERLGCSLRTLQEDIALYEGLRQTSVLQSGTTATKADLTVAVKAGKGNKKVTEQIVRKAEDERAADPNYSSGQLAQYANELTGAVESGDEQAEQDAEATKWIQVGISPEAHNALLHLIQATGLRTTGEVIEKLVLAAKDMERDQTVIVVNESDIDGFNEDVSWWNADNAAKPAFNLANYLGARSEARCVSYRKKAEQANAAI